MRLLQTGDISYINLDAVVRVNTYNNGRELCVRLADNSEQRFRGDDAQALTEILLRNSTDLRELVALNRKHALAVQAADLEGVPA